MAPGHQFIGVLRRANHPMMAPALVRRLRLKRYDILSGSLFHCTYFRKTKVHPPSRARTSSWLLFRSRRSPHLSPYGRLWKRSWRWKNPIPTNMLTLCDSISPLYLSGTSLMNLGKEAQSRTAHSWVTGGQSQTSSWLTDHHVDDLRPQVGWEPNG